MSRGECGELGQRKSRNWLGKNFIDDSLLWYYLSGDEKRKKKTENKTDKRDYSHLPRARDYKLPDEISPELKEAMKATREAMEALHLEEEKYGKKSNLWFIGFLALR